MQLPFNFDRAIDGLSKVTLRGGVVGKVTFSVTLVSLSLAAIAWTVSNVWLSSAIAVMVFTLTMVLLLRIIDFADRHPQAALLEGAEFLVHEQIIHATKTVPVLSSVEIQPAQPEAVEGPSASVELAQMPDQEPQPLANAGGQH